MGKRPSYSNRLYFLFVLLTIIAFFLFQQSKFVLSANTNAPVSRKSNMLYYLPLIKQSPNANWVSVGFAGENATDLYLDPSLPGHAYASIYAVGLFETYDGGNNWTQLHVDSRIYDIAVHPITPATMYIATWSSYGLYWTENGGNSWQPIPGWPSLAPTLYSVAIHPITSTLMLAGSGNWEPNGGEIFKTVNGGQDWFLVSPMFTNALTFAFDPVAPTIVYAGTQYAGVQKSTDTGYSWFAANNGLPIGTTGAHDIHVAVQPDLPQRVYAATSLGVYLSEDQAENWQALWEGVDANFLLFDHYTSERIYLGTNDGIFVSYDTGLRWFRLGQCGIGASVKRLVSDPYNDNAIWAATSNGLWRCILE